jgi:hypothetical protein
MTAAVLDAPLAPEDLDEPEGFDPDAPYGRRPTGEPYKRPQATREKLAAALNGARAHKGIPKAPLRGSKPRKAASASTGKGAAPTDYRPAVASAVGLVAFGFSMVGKTTGSDALTLDAATLQLNAGGIAEVMQTAAAESQQISAVLDRLMTAGPWGDAVVLVLGIGTQMLANHKVIPPNPALGVLGPEDLLARLKASAEA